MKRVWVRPAALAIAAVVALNLVLAGVGSLARTPSGPASSSYATQPAGLAAYAELLRRSGHPVVALRRRPADRTLDARTTVVMLDPQDITPSEARALRRFVERGGTLVAGGLDAGSWLGDLLAPAPRWAAGGAAVARPLTPIASVTTVRSAAEGRWADDGRATATVGGASTLLLTQRIGMGHVALLADASPLQNRLLARDDNAQLGLDLAARAGRPVAFVETVHGYGEQRGLAGLPIGWRRALLGLAAAALVWVLSQLRRIGPPELAQRPLPPARRRFLEAVGGALSRTHDPSAVGEPLQAFARERVAARAALGRDPDSERLRAGAERLGFSPDEVDGLLTPVLDERTLLAAGHALAAAERRVR